MAGASLVLAVGCAGTAEMPAATTSTADTGDETTGLSIGSLVTGVGDVSNTGPDDDGTTSSSATSGSTGPGTSSESTGPGDGESTASSGSEGSTGGDPPLPAYCDPTIPMAGDEPLIDDLELEPGQMLPDDEIPNHDGRVGYWFTYNDGTPAAMQTPVPGSFQPSVGGAAGTGYSAGTSGQGFVSWGAGMGVKLNNDFSGDCPYDASSYDGITFWGRGNVPVRLLVTTRATHPIAQGGTCDPGMGQCADHFGINLVLGPMWQEHTVEWGDLLQQGWGIPAAFDPGQIIEVQWQVSPGQVFDVQIDELQLWRP
ncbi:hypothetical protein [Paraliomyxa miuraensis]|uniref:hypothetical protein n=1 Tax=Paraliomyxa miuraensis TaxID=376150 RepID=UPI00224F9A2E|nr:hypothetical protein [Paraliomyxa miuraensis]MCX4240805.1 hypothetical protein [Paraliomyxa miuraensis]